MITEQRVYFTIQSNHLSPEQITRHLGMAPTRAEAKESRRGGRSGRPIPPRHEWIMDSGLPETTSLDDQVEAVLSRLDGACERIGELTSLGSEAGLVVFRSFEPGPASTRLGLLLSEETIGFLHKAGAHIWIDEYGYDEEQPGDGDITSWGSL
ncbi:DUF4279 domain-containing protein [Streptosporangium canum]|uniref:DUF4279 domain-containing protein n=1 Tax=Streptosporangium canum TaxID=324952 RepID=UPI0034288DC6